MQATRWRSALARAAAVVAITGLGSAAWAQPAPVTVGDKRLHFSLLGTLPTGAGPAIDLAHSHDGTGRLFVAGQGESNASRVSLFSNGAFQSTPFLTLNNATLGNNLIVTGERGLLGMAFHPNYAAAAVGTPGRGKFYTYTSEPIVNLATNFTHPEIGTGGGNHQSVLREWSVSSSNPNIIDVSAGASSSRVVMRINQPQDNHNGGAIKFDSAGQLYIALGDGGGGNDFDGNINSATDGHTNGTGNAQDRSNVYGKILRIDPVGTAGALSANGQYRIPSSNPFASDSPTANTVDEIFAYGLRNPFRMSLHRTNGSLYAGDVGQGSQEEVSLITAGGNYGWVYREGTRVNRAGEPAGMIGPLGEYARADGRSVIGGYAYTGTNADLAGLYIFGDAFGNASRGRFFYMNAAGGPISEFQHTGASFSGNLYSFGEDEHGNLYAVMANGNIYAIVPEPAGIAIAGAVAAGLLLRRSRRQVVARASRP